ncbi:dockerin type I domain-containing protein [Ruegeria arenilitoris]|uniref:dockerin type I domain-containing protein n=1 Tax=Ruegeria arenilitoris TaxID=1173585 RepID=UPI00147D504B|nr:dockerin type I domain-containing protein [Ruegeria arenilitoris]
MMLRFDRMVATGFAALDSGIGDTCLKIVNGDTHIFSFTGVNGGIASWKLVEGAGPLAADQQLYDVAISQQVGRSAVSRTFGDQTHLILDVDNALGLVSYDLSASGTIGDLHETDGLTGGGDISAAAQVSSELNDLLVLSHSDTGRLGTYRVDDFGNLAVVGTVSGHADVLQTLQSGADQFVIAANTTSSEITTYRVHHTFGKLAKIEANSAFETLGINAPTAVEVVQAYGKSWVVVASAGSSSLSVMKLGTDGRLTPTDHVLDSLHTRFESVQDLAVLEVEGRVFVIAGGGDDGVTLFTMTQDGQLIYLNSFADTLASGLQNVQTLSVAHIGQELQIFAASQHDAGLTQLNVSLAGLGVVQKGSGTLTGTSGGDMLRGGIFETALNGGAGDDILITGTRSTTMTGGSGADIFVLRQGSGHTIITDFEAGTDTLDLSDFFLLRTPSQLEFTSTAQGAQIWYRDEGVEITSDGNGPLTSADIFGTGFEGPDHVPVIIETGPDANAAPGVQGRVSLDSSAANPALAGAELRFTPNSGSTITVQANALGEFDLEMPDGIFSGELEIVKSYDIDSYKVSSLDALQILRIAVGLDPTFGPATPENLIAADLNQDGIVSSMDALIVLRNAVGLPTEYPARWVFLDAETDLSAIFETNVRYVSGTQVTVTDGEFATEMTSILLGNIELI